MKRLMRTSEVAKRPVVTRDGEDIAQIKDVVYVADGGAVDGFTLAGRGLLAGPKGEVLPWSEVGALGSHAVMIDSPARLAEDPSVFAGLGGKGGGDVLGSQVLTDAGTDLGSVVDVVLEIDTDDHTCDVVGYEVDPSEALAQGGASHRVLIPLPDTLAASEEHLIVPASATDFVRSDLSGFGAAVDDFRAQLGERS